MVAAMTQLSESLGCFPCLKEYGMSAYMLCLLFLVRLIFHLDCNFPLAFERLHFGIGQISFGASVERIAAQIVPAIPNDIVVISPVTHKDQTRLVSRWQPKFQASSINRQPKYLRTIPRAHSSLKIGFSPLMSKGRVSSTISSAENRLRPR